MTSLWNSETETWNNIPDNIRRTIHRDTTEQDIQSELELLK